VLQENFKQKPKNEDLKDLDVFKSTLKIPNDPDNPA
jgi:hypothetical protein